MHRHLLKRYLLPEPRNALAEALRRHASAAMDVSDGLAGDLGKLCRASGVGATVDVARVPLSDAALTALVADERATQTILTGGDDFEVVATIPPAQAEIVPGGGAPRPRQRHRDRTHHGRVRRPVPRRGRQAASVRPRLIQPFLTAPAAL